MFFKLREKLNYLTEEKVLIGTVGFKTANNKEEYFIPSVNQNYQFFSLKKINTKGILQQNILCLEKLSMMILD